MVQRGLACLLLAGMAWGQAVNTPPTNGPSAPQADPSKVAPTAAVITIPGLCSDGKTSSPDCKTVITKEEFEGIINAVAPKMPAMAKKQFANRYAMGLVMAQAAEKEGVDKTPKYDQMMKLMRVQVMQQLLSQSVQEKAGQVTDKEIADYYAAHKSNYDEADLQKIFVPRMKQSQDDKPMESMNEPMGGKKDDAAVAEMKKVADDLRAKAAAGGDFTKLQQEAYKDADIKTDPPNVNMGKTRRVSMPPPEAVVMDLKPGEVSQVIDDGGGFEIYKMVGKTSVPLDKVTDEIRNTMRSQRTQEMMQSIQKSSTPVLDEAYFGPAGPTGPGGPMSGPGRPQPPTIAK